MFSVIQNEANVLALINDLFTLFWPTNFCGPRVQQELIKKMEKTKNIILVCFGLMGVAMIPIWIDIKDFLLCFHVYEYYFGVWAKIPYYLFVFTFPWLAFSSVRLPFMLIYAIVQIQMQVFLINQQITEISAVHGNGNDLNYQNKISEKLQMCIKHHIMLKK